MATDRQSKPFDPGQVVATPGALAAIEAAGQSPLHFLLRHLSGDWGEVSPSDAEMNDEATLCGGRIHSAYRTARGERIWVITEADRSSTCVLLPDEY